MKRFQKNPTILQSKDARKIIRMYNKMAKTLVEFETLWYEAWLNSIEVAKSGLHATLIVRHPDDGKFYVNFDWEILQLIRETKCLERIGVEVPGPARLVLLQEQKFKQHYNELSYILKEYRRVVQAIKPVVTNLLKPHMDNMEYQLRPGMIALTWTSLNIESYVENLWSELNALEELVRTVNDLMDNRIDANLKDVSCMILLELPEEGEVVSLDDFVELQERHVRDMTSVLTAKSAEIEAAVDDMLGAIVAYPVDPNVHGVSESELIKVKAHYNWSMYQALLSATKRSLQLLKARICARPIVSSVEYDELPSPFFEVNLQLDGVSVRLDPSVEELQSAVNGGAVSILKCSKMIEAWDTVTIPKSVQMILNPNLPPVISLGSQGTFYDRVAQDKEILKVILMLTGAVQNSEDECNVYLERFSCYGWLWEDSIEDKYKEFEATNPTLDDFECKLRSFAQLDEKLDLFESSRQIGALLLRPESLAKGLKGLANEWKVAFSKQLHVKARDRLEALTEQIKTTAKRMNRTVEDGDIDALGYVMRTLNDVRRKQSEIELEFGPITHMYAILDTYLPKH
ncbi:hypothetical protein Pmar_PMAR024462, partial [Perkinsus marinus ATCC 50983]